MTPFHFYTVGMTKTWGYLGFLCGTNANFIQSFSDLESALLDFLIPEADSCFISLKNMSDLRMKGPLAFPQISHCNGFPN